MKTNEELKEFLSKENFTFESIYKIVEYLKTRGLLENLTDVKYSVNPCKPFVNFSSFMDWFESDDVWDITWKSCKELIEKYESIISILKEAEGCSENVFIKNEDGKSYKYQGGIRRELEKELTDRVILLDTILSLSIKNKEEGYVDYIREKIEEINSKLMELDEE